MQARGLIQLRVKTTTWRQPETSSESPWCSVAPFVPDENYICIIAEQTKWDRPPTTTPLVFHHPQFGACHSNSVLSLGCLRHGDSFCQLDWWNLWSQDKDDDLMLVNWATVLRETKAGPPSLQLKAQDSNFTNAELWPNAAPSEISRKATGNPSTDLSVKYFGTSHLQLREGWGRRQRWRWH